MLNVEKRAVVRCSRFARALLVETAHCHMIIVSMYIVHSLASFSVLILCTLRVDAWRSLRWEWKTVRG